MKLGCGVLDLYPDIKEPEAVLRPTHSYSSLSVSRRGR